MEIDINDIDFDSLREDLINYFGTASTSFPMAMVDVVNIQSASNIELLNILNNTTLDINDYINNNYTK